jgi:hypothetical protein
MSVSLFAQEEAEDNQIKTDTLQQPTETNETKESDTTRFKVGDVEFLIIDHDTIPAGGSSDMGDGTDFDSDDDGYPSKGSMTYWSGIDIGMNVLMNANKEFTFNSQHLQLDPSNSWSFSINLLEQRIRIAKDYLGIVTGIGFTNQRFGFKDSYLRLAANGESTFGVIDSSLVSGFSKNQLRVNYFNIPLLIQINTAKRSRRNFHIAFGAIGSVRMNSNVKYKFESVTGETKNKEKGRFNLNPFQVAATARIGYRDFGLFANYNFLPLFERDKSEIAYPLTFGASFHF